LYRHFRGRSEGRGAAGVEGARDGARGAGRRDRAGPVRAARRGAWRWGRRGAAAGRKGGAAADLRGRRGPLRPLAARVGGEALVVSQFTLLADTAKGNRPSFGEAAPPEQAEPLYEAFCEALRAQGLRVATGVFGARMAVELVNDGPVTIVL